jgi:hypothetical protein
LCLFFENHQRAFLVVLYFLCVKAQVIVETIKFLEQFIII